MNIDNKVEEYNAKINEMQASITATLKEAFKEIFKEAPNLHMICWAQYAPYYSDGDPCEFSVNEMYAVNKDFANEDENDEYEEFPTPWHFEDDLAQYRMEKPSDWYFKNYPNNPSVVAWNQKDDNYKKEIETVNKFMTAIASIPDDVFKSAFGYDNAVYVLKDRIVSEDFSGNHD